MSRSLDWRGVLPLLGLVVIGGFFAATADLGAVAGAISGVDLVLMAGVMAGTLVSAWVADSLCLHWLMGVTLPSTSGLRIRDTLALKAWSYLLNVVNYNAATVGMGVALARRTRASVVETTAGLAVLSYLDLLALGALISAGMLLRPAFLGQAPAELAQGLGVVVTTSWLGALALLLLTRTGSHRLLVRLRELPVVRPLARLSPAQLLTGVALRVAFVQLYVGYHYGLMLALGMEPDLATLWVLLPVVTMVGVLPLSIAGIGTVQVAMRVLYPTFLPEGAGVELIDAFSTLVVVGLPALRLAFSVPFVLHTRADHA